MRESFKRTCAGAALLGIFLLQFKTAFCRQGLPLAVGETKTAGSFPLVAGGKAAMLVTDTADAMVVQITASAFSKDVEAVTGLTPAIGHAIPTGGYPVIIGTLGKSAIIDQLAAKQLIPTGRLKGQWETFCISVVNNPFKNIKAAVVVFGSDPRGTAFGLFELSRMMGVSPLVWWADVKPQPRKTLYVSPGNHIIGPPSIKYRGIFINDEDWGMKPWAAAHLDKELKDIGPNTYAKVFELMLRVKANYLWPAMHPCTKAFWYYPGNPEMARNYDIVLGASHCEPLLRNNVFEWSENFKNEYGVAPGKWRYDSNKVQIDRYWTDRVRASAHNDAVYTVGMRGIHDSGMPGPPSKEKKKELLEEVIQNQRKILHEGLEKPSAEVPQIFCPYKEVLDLYRMGMQLPDDIILAWADDNYGYIRQLSNPREQERSGGSGVYYHFSYWGWPEDYLWLSTISPVLTSYELSKAWRMGAKKLWVFNVGDIKPAEMELQFAMDLAWDVNAWPPEKAHLYPEYWSAATFGKAFAKSIGHIKKEYYRLAASGKPEQLGHISFTAEETATRLKDYRALVAKSKAISGKIPARLKDAYFELIAYPVEASCSMNEKILDTGKAAAFGNIQRLTNLYNTGIAGGKWNGMMSYHPRDLPIFMKPETSAAAITERRLPAAGDTDAGNHLFIPATGYVAKHNAGSSLIAIEGLGIGNSALTVWPMTLETFTKQNVLQAPYAEYHIPVKAGRNTIQVKCLPDFPLYAGMQLRYAVSIDGSPPAFVDIATLAETKPWATNLLRGWAAGETRFDSDSSGVKTLRIYFTDPGLVIHSIVIYDR